MLTPNQPVSRRTEIGIAAGWTLLLIALWQYWPSPILPRPAEVIIAARDLWLNEGLGEQLVISYSTQIKALVVALAMSLSLAYAATVPLVRPLVVFISTWRFISLGPLVIFFSVLITSEGSALKLWLLVFAISVFYITSMLPVVLDVPTDELNHARTLHMGHWHSTYEVIVLGRLDMALEMLRQNAAMGWMMLTMVEGLVRSEGGVGALLLNQVKHFRLAHVAAIIAVLFIVGWAQDIALKHLRIFLFPYADLEKRR